MNYIGMFISLESTRGYEREKDHEIHRDVQWKLKAAVVYFMGTFEDFIL